MAIKIILADDHVMIRAGIKSLIERDTDYEVIAETTNGRETVQMVQKLEPDVVVMDISMPELNGIEATRQIKAIDEDILVVALSVHKEVTFVRQMLKAGADAYLVKHSEFEELVEAIRTVLRGKSYLSPTISDQVIHDYLRHLPEKDSLVFTKLSSREQEVLQMLVEGKSKKEIADALHLSVKTIDSHRQNIMHKLSITNFSDLVRYAIREGISEL